MDINSFKQNLESAKATSGQAENKVNSAKAKVDTTPEFNVFQKEVETEQGTQTVTYTEENQEYKEALSALDAAHDELSAAEADEMNAQEELEAAEEEIQNSDENSATVENHGIETTTVYDSEGNGIEKTIKDKDKTYKITYNDGAEVAQELDSEGNVISEIELDEWGKTTRYNSDGSTTEIYEDYGKINVDQKNTDGTLIRTWSDDDGYSQVNFYDADKNLTARSVTRDGRTEVYDENENMYVFDLNGNLIYAKDKENKYEMEVILDNGEYKRVYTDRRHRTPLTPEQIENSNLNEEKLENTKNIFTQSKEARQNADLSIKETEITKQNIIFSQEETIPNSIQSIIEEHGEEYMREENINSIIRELLTTSKLTGEKESPNSETVLGREFFLTWNEIEYISQISPSKGEALKKIAEDSRNKALVQNYQLPSNVAIATDITSPAYGSSEYYKAIFG